MFRNSATTDAFERQTDAAGDQLRDSRVVDYAMALYGEHAPTAAAFCALEAWHEGKKGEYEFWLRIFRQLRN